MNREQGDRTTKAARLGISQISPSDAIPSAAVCAIRKKKHNVNEWETGNRLNPCLDTVMSACKQRLSSREPLSAVTTRLRDAFLFWLASLLLVRSLITGAGRMKALPDMVDSLQTRRWKQFVSSHSWETYEKAKRMPIAYWRFVLLTVKCKTTWIWPSPFQAQVTNLTHRRTGEGPEGL